MNAKKELKNADFSIRNATAYGIGQFSDTMAIQMFVFFIFTFYYAVVGINVNLITIGYIIWSLWNSINDPLLGAWSDRTKTKWGRRTPFIYVSFIPLCAIVVLIWMPPIGSEILSFVYFLVFLLLFDTFYTMFDLNYASLFPEQFQDLTTRAKANSIKQIFTILGLIVVFILPTLIIPKLDDKRYFLNWRIAGLVISILIGIGVLVLIKFGLKEKIEFKEDSKNAPSLFKSLRISIKSKSFRTFIVANVGYWYVIGMLATIVPLYGIYVLNIGEGQSFLLGLLLGVAFISAAFFMILWRYISTKFGMKNGIIISMIAYIFVLFPFMIVSNVTFAFFAFILVGLGIAGGLFFGDILLAAVIDEDELKTGIRREGGYYGINALFTKLSTILVILTINVVFNSVGWTYFNPKSTTENTILGLRALMFIFPAIALGIGILAISRFPINKEKYLQIKSDVEKLHKEKKEKLNI